MAPSTVIVRLIITGRVQGVGFRAFIEREARRRDLRGWVRNRLDGAVEAVVAGRDDGVEGMIAASRRGPRAGRVDAVEIIAASEDALKGAQSFLVLPTV